MDRFAPAVRRLPAQGRIALWHSLTGRHLALSPESLAEIERWEPGAEPPPRLGALAARLAALHLLAAGGRSAPDLARLRPARSRNVLLLPEVPALWMPVPAVRTAGGFGYTERRLTATEVALWRACNGARSTAEAAARAGCGLEEALAFFATLTTPEAQALQLRDSATGPRDPGLLYLLAPDRPAAARPDHLYGPGGETDLARYHAEISGGERHFDDRETTVAHAFALPHPGLQGEPYGARLRRALAARAMAPEEGLILEIGPGDGELGEAWLAAGGGEYARLDLSPELLAQQRRRMPGTREMLGSATDIPLPDGSVALVVSNEVIADLAAAPFEPGVEAEGPAAEVAAYLERYGIAPEPGRALYNLGAWRMLEEVARVLARGGAAYVSEFGDLEGAPAEAEQLDHPEVSIHFGHLLRVAAGLGLRAECLPLADLMGFNLQESWLARHSYDALRARMRAEGRHLAARAYTPQTLALPWAVEGLEWAPLSQPGPGPLITRFHALLLRK